MGNFTHSKKTNIYSVFEEQESNYRRVIKAVPIGFNESASEIHNEYNKRSLPSQHHCNYDAGNMVPSKRHKLSQEEMEKRAKKRQERKEAREVVPDYIQALYDKTEETCKRTSSLNNHAKDLQIAKEEGPSATPAPSPPFPSIPRVAPGQWK